jgi:hypothetical protein
MGTYREADIMDLKFVSTTSIPVSGVVSIGAMICDPPAPHNALSLVDYSNMYPGNVIGAPQLYNSDNVPVTDFEPKDRQIVISDKTIYANTTDMDTIILGYEYQLKYDHYDTGNPSGTIRVCYPGGDEVPGAVYTIETCTNAAPISTLWNDYATNGAGMYQRYNANLTWGPKPTGVNVYRLRILLPESLCFDKTIYVSYTKYIKDGSGNAVTSDGWREIINPKKLYTYGTNYTFAAGVITLSTLSTAWVQRSKLANIRVYEPEVSGRNGWFVKVWAGAFTQGTNKYNVQEYLSHQAAMVKFNSTGTLISPRCGLAVYDPASQSDEYTINLNEWPLHIWSDGYPTYVPYPAYDAVHYTGIDPTSSENYSHGISIFVNGNKIDQACIVDWDEWNGMVRLNTAVPMGYDIRATYVHEQMYYTVQVPDMCPQVHHIGLSYGTGNALVGVPANDAVVLVLIPTGGETNTNERLAWYYKSQNPTDIYGSSYKGYSTVLKASPSATANITLPAGTLKLAEIGVKRVEPDSYTTLYDTRSRGGGLLPDDFYKVTTTLSREDIQLESYHYGDIGLYDGLGLKKDGVIVVKIPRESIDSIRDAIVDYSMEEIKSIASSMRDDDSSLSEANSITQATTLYRDQYAYRSSIDTVMDVARSNAAAGTIVVLVDEDMNIL